MHLFKIFDDFGAIKMAYYRCWFLLCLFILFAPFSSLLAESCEQKHTLQELRAHALKHSPLVAEIDRDYANTLAQAIEKEVLPNPELQLEQTYTNMQLGGDNDPQSMLALSQPLRISDFGAREQVAILMKKAGDVEKRRHLLELTQRLAVKFYTLFSLQQAIQVVTNAEERLRNKIVLVKQAVNKGLLSIGEEKLFEGERFRLEAYRSGVLANIATLQNELSNMIGSLCNTIAVADMNLEQVPALEQLIEKAAASTINESTRVKLLQQLAVEQVRLTERDTFPQFTPRLVYQHTNDGGDFFGAGISISIPFWDRNQAEKTRKEGENKAINATNIFLANGGFEAQIRNMRSAAVSFQEQAEIYANKVVPAFEAAFRSQEKLFEEGKGSVLQVWQSLRALNEVQIQAISLWLDAVTNNIYLMLLVGAEG